MIRKIISLHVFAALICIVAAAVANADCATCGGGCADGACLAKKGGGGLLARFNLLSGKSCLGGGCDTAGCTTCAAPAAPVVLAPAAPCASGGCPSGKCGVGGGCLGNGACGVGCGGGCGGKLLGKLHSAFAPVDDGICRTCDNIWDDYCATKRNCLPGPKYPLQNHHGCSLCGATGACGCGNGNGVGIYGGMSACGACGASPCKCGGHKLIHNLFAKKGCGKKGCDAPACDGGCSAAAAAPVQLAPPVVHAAPVHQAPVQQNFSYSVPSYPTETPVYSNESYSTPVATDPIIESQSVNPTPVDSLPPVPPSPSDLPAITDQSSTTGAFDWLQRALQLN